MIFLKQKHAAKLTLFALALNAFAIGSTEFISVGLLPMIVNHFQVSLAQASLTVSLYALGVTIGAPVLTILTGKMSRYHLMLGIMLCFIVGNILAATAFHFSILLLGRIISALAHGIFMSISTVIAADVVAEDKRASAIAIMFTGLTVATVTGVPLGTFLGQQFGWQVSFIFIALVGLLGFIANIFLIPKNLPIPGKVDLTGIKRIFSQPLLVIAFIITAFGYGGTFAAYTYLSPILKQLHFSNQMIVFILIGYGIMVAIGNTLGGRFANKNQLRALIYMFSLLIASLIFLYFTIIYQQAFLGLIATALLGLFAFMNVPGLQLYIVELAEKLVAKDITLASALNIAAFNIGITLGSSVGAKTTDLLGLNFTPLAGAIIVFIAIVLILVIQNMEQKAIKNINVDESV